MRLKEKPKISHANLFYGRSLCEGYYILLILVHVKCKRFRIPTS